jgi:hypothetical protein
MIILENKIIGEKYVDGYYLTIKDLEKLVRDFQVDCHDGFVSNDKAYIEEWLKKHERIVKVKNWNEEFKKMDEAINDSTVEPPEGFDYFFDGEK